MLGQVQTERGLIYVEACFKTKEQAKEAGYTYAFSSKRLGAELYSRCLDDRGLCHAFAAVFS